MSDTRNHTRTRSSTRRRLLRLGGVGLGALIAGCSGSTDGSGTDETPPNGTEPGSGKTTTAGETTTTGGNDDFTPWQWRRSDPGQTYSSPDPAPKSLDDTATYRLESNQVTRAAPAVTDAGVFLLGSGAARIDTADGAATYSRSIGGSGQAFLQDDLLVLPNEYDGRVIGYRASDAERQWVAEPGSVVPFPTGDGVGYVGIQRLGVLDPDSGENRWETTRSESEVAFSAGLGRPWVAHPGSGTLYGGRYDRFDNRLIAVEAYDANTGERRWRREDVPAPFAVHGETLFASGRGATVVALDRTNGDELWRALKERSVVIGGYAVDADGVYVWTGTDNADVVALDRKTGEERWREPFTGRLGGTAATGDAVVYRTSKKLRLLSKDDGSELLATRDESIGASPLAAAGGRLYVSIGTYGSAMRVYEGR